MDLPSWLRHGARFRKESSGVEPPEKAGPPKAADLSLSLICSVFLGIFDLLLK
jgi:hypothetical protein